MSFTPPDNGIHKSKALTLSKNSFNADNKRQPQQLSGKRLIDDHQQSTLSVSITEQQSLEKQQQHCQKYYVPFDIVTAYGTKPHAAVATCSKKNCISTGANKREWKQSAKPLDAQVKRRSVGAASRDELRAFTAHTVDGACWRQQAIFVQPKVLLCWSASLPQQQQQVKKACAKL